MRRNTLFLSFMLLISCQFAQNLCFDLSPQAMAYDIDKSNHEIVISPKGDYTADARNALQYLLKRPDQDTLWVMRFQPGKYYLTLPMYSVGLRNVNIISNPDNPARLIKSPDFTGSEYLFFTRMSKNVKFYGFELYGRTNFQNSKGPVWGDQGLYFGSCNTIAVTRNKFYNFGDAALRVTTAEADPVRGVNSYNTVVNNNYFNNIYQISTSSNDTIHGATSAYRLQENTFVNLRGSVKFASRTEGAKDVRVISNTFNGGDHYGLEIDNYNNFEIRGNTFENIKDVAINIYTATDANRVKKGFNWGDSYTISDNVIAYSGRGIRYSHEAFSDGHQYVPSKLVISNNKLSYIKEPRKNFPAIGILHGRINGLNLVNNQMKSISSKNYLNIFPGCMNVVDTGNIAEGLKLRLIVGEGGASVGTTAGGGVAVPPGGSSGGSSGGGTTTPPPSSSTGKPNAPSILAGQKISSSSVRLTWKDNATNESYQQVWGSLDGNRFSLIAKINPNSKTFVHQFKKLPPQRVIYYVVKAVNGSGTSGLSNKIRIAL